MLVQVLIENTSQFFLSLGGFLVLVLLTIFLSKCTKNFKFFTIAFLSITFLIHVTGQLLNLYANTGVGFFQNLLDFDIYTHFLLGISLALFVLNFHQGKWYEMLALTLIFTVGLEISEFLLVLFGYPFLTYTFLNSVQDLLMSTAGSLVIILMLREMKNGKKKKRQQ